MYINEVGGSVLKFLLFKHLLSDCDAKNQSQAVFFTVKL